MITRTNWMVFGILFTLVLPGCRRGSKSFYPPDEKVPSSAYKVQVKKHSSAWEVHITNNSGHAYTHYNVHIEAIGQNAPPATIKGGDAWKNTETKTFRISQMDPAIVLCNKLRVAVGASDEAHPYTGKQAYTYEGRKTRATYYNSDFTIEVP